jgi:hypothetical protein
VRSSWSIIDDHFPDVAAFAVQHGLGGVDRHPDDGLGTTNGEGGMTSCIGLTFTSSRAGPGCASQATTASSSSPAFETQRPQRPIASATLPKSGLVWTLRHVDTGGKRRTFGSLLHGTMASGMPSAIGLQKCQPGRQVVCMAGDGGFTMLLGDLLTVVQENLPIKIVVFDNGKLGFIDIEQKSAGIEPIFTDLKNISATLLLISAPRVSQGPSLRRSSVLHPSPRWGIERGVM